MPFFRRIRGVRASLPSGSILGRHSAGQGAAEILTAGDLVQQGMVQQPTAQPGTGGTTGGIPAGGTNGQVLTLVAGSAVWATLPVDDDSIGPGDAGGMLPLVNGDTPGPSAIADDKGQFIGVPL